jgi:NAD(P)-dependent dehydrogenase (short-subunit alcohol dehydrogenase family)
VTGSSRGFGRSLVHAAVAAGHQVVATARNPATLAEIAGKHPDAVLPVALDVTDPRAVAAALEAGASRFGRLDVVVNNAGYANVAPIETADDADVRAQFETNFWGVYHVSKAAVPLMRAQGGGTLVQFSSVGGRVGGSAGIAAYQAAKFAVDGFSRVLAAETAAFGIRVMVVEPSGFATDWAGSSMSVAPVPEEYRSTVGVMGERRGRSTPAGDPDRAAEIVVRTVDRAELPSHLLLGVNAVEMAASYSRRQVEEATAWAEVGRSADFSEPYPVELPS